MAQVINTNIASLNAQRNLNSSQAGTNQALQRLSSGLRINSAKDDAAGLAISTRFESQIKGLNVAIRNAGDGVSLAQTAEGALGSMTESLQRVRELALQAANGTNSAADRQALQAEAKLLIEEISRVSEGANFNGVNLLDGSLSTSFQVGANAGESIAVSIGKLTADTLGVSTKNGVSATGTSSALNVGDLVINGVTVGASRASDDTASTSGAAASAIAKAAAINRVASESGVRAVVDTNVAGGSAMTASAQSGSVTLNGTTINLDTTNNGASSRAAVVSAINSQSNLTGITAVDSGDDALGVTLTAADGRNIELSFGGDLTASNTGLASAGTYTGGVTLVADSGVAQINISGANTANAGVAAGSYTAGVSTVSSVSRYAESGSSASTTGGVDLRGINYDFSLTQNDGVAAEVTGTVAIDAAADLAFDTTAVTSGTLAGNVDIAALGPFEFGEIDGGTAADLTGTVDLEAAIPGSLNFAAVQFEVDVDGDAYTVTLDGDYSGVGGLTQLVDDINAQLEGSGVTASLDESVPGEAYLVFTEDRNEGKNITFNDINSASAIFGIASGNDSTNDGTAGVAGDLNSITFEISVDGGAAQEITLNTNLADADALVAAIQAQLEGATVSVADGTGFLTITSDTTGADSNVTITGIVGAAGDGFYLNDITGLDNGDVDGTNGTAVRFTVSDGTNESTIVLDQDYTNDTVGMVSFIQSQLDADNVGVTVAMVEDDDNPGNYTLQFTETANPPAGATITVSDASTGGHTDLNTLLGVSSASDEGEAFVAADQNATFTVNVDGGAAQQININTNITNETDLLAAINDQLEGATAGLDNDGNLTITSATTGATSTVQISDLGGSAASELGLADANVSGVNGAFGVENLADGDLVINGVSIGAARASDDTASYAGAFSSSKEASGISMAAAINRASASTGVTATVNATQVVGDASTAGTAGDTGTLTVNGVSVNMVGQGDADANRAFAVSQINSISGQTGVVAEDNGSSVTLTAADGRNVSLAFDTAGGASATNFGLGASAIAEPNFAGQGVPSADNIAVTTYATVTLSSAGTIDVSGGTNGNSALAGLGLEQGAFGGAVSGQFLNQVDISTQKGATDALAAIDNALNAVNGARADLGAVQNRFEATISNLEINSENLSAANSRIRDADFAAEAANLARSQVLQQAGISILSQANASGQQVLSLLQ